jgi:hypothetical protein
MTGKNNDIKVSDASGVRKVEFQYVVGANRPYYWSWYRTVFDEPTVPVKVPVKIPPS